MPVVFITTTGAGTWETPDGTTSIDSVECIGGGGGGRTGGTTNSSGGGGGGGAYSKRTSISFTENQVFDFNVGAGGSAGVAGGDTWFGATSLASSLVGAKGGSSTAGTAGGAGGLNTSGFPTSGGTRNSGGAGGAGNNTIFTGGGGGGAGGPGGTGGTGGNGDTASTGADFGGSGGSGAGTSTAGGNAGATPSTAAGTVGTNADGGGSGGSGGSGAGATPTASTSMWTSTAGPGAGTGGGGGGSGSSSAAPGSGANYGGGGGGRGAGTGGASAGGNGIIIITYTASVPAFTGPTYVSAGTHLEGASVNMSYHAGVQAGRTAILLLAGGSAAPNTPSGWSVVSVTTTGDVMLKVCIKALTGSESGSFTIDSIVNDVSARMYYFDGVDTASMTESPNEASGAAGTTSPDSIVTTGAMRLGITATAHTGTQNAPLSTNWTEAAESDVGSYVLALDTRNMPSAGTKVGSPRTASTSWGTVTFALKPVSQLAPPRDMHHYRCRRV